MEPRLLEKFGNANLTARNFFVGGYSHKTNDYSRQHNHNGRKAPFAKAVLIKDGVFVYIGGAETAKTLADADAQIPDYGENFIYPGFLEAHCHEYFAGFRAVGQANLSHVTVSDYAEYRRIIKDFIAKNPNLEYYMAGGWTENNEYVTKAYPDEICPDKPLIM